MDLAEGKRLLAIKERIVANFNSSNWEEIGLLTGITDLIRGHGRLLRSLDWGDADYAGNVIEVLTNAHRQNPEITTAIESYLDEHYGVEGFYVSSKIKEKKITFSPDVFEVPPLTVQGDLVSVMMPFEASFNPVYAAIQSAVTGVGQQCRRADDIWEESVVVQDIFNLIFRSRIVIVDFTGKNPNVMYETGIAHTLGKQVVPITQSIEHVPFDLRHHRSLVYLSNSEGLASLTETLSARLRNLMT